MRTSLSHRFFAKEGQETNGGLEKLKNGEKTIGGRKKETCTGETASIIGVGEGLQNSSTKRRRAKLGRSAGKKLQL